MKKNLVTGLVAVGLILAGGTGFAVANAKEKAQDTSYSMQQGMGNVQMTQMMKSVSTTGTQKQDDQSSFEQMLPYMKKMHPNLSAAQLKALYEKMMGANGACSNRQGMMGNTNSDGQGMMGNTNSNGQGMMGNTNSNGQGMMGNSNSDGQGMMSTTNNNL